MARRRGTECWAHPFSLMTVRAAESLRCSHFTCAEEQYKLRLQTLHPKPQSQTTKATLLYPFIVAPIDPFKRNPILIIKAPNPTP